jgi:hypothetical protein
MSFIKLGGLYTAGHQQIGLGYCAFALLGGVVGTTLSGIMRMAIAIGPGMPGQLYNAAITAHAVVMIFFMVMPALFGGFGDFPGNLETTRVVVSENVSESEGEITAKNEEKLMKMGHYLAGLIEGDGSIVVPIYILVDRLKSVY